MKPRISAIIIAKNEEVRIGKCLASLAFAGERIVVDNGSTDKTAAIARGIGAKVVDAKDRDFASVRELGMREASGKWILYIDADEEVGVPLGREIQKITRSRTTNRPDVYFIKRDTYYLGYHWPYRDMVERVFLKSALKGWHGRLHETPVFTGPTGILMHPLVHRTHRTLEEMLEKTNDWSQLEAELRIAAHHPPVVWWRFLRVIWSGFFRSFIDQRGWRAGTIGWIESIYQGFSMFITYAKLWEMQQGKNTK